MKPILTLSANAAETDMEPAMPAISAASSNLRMRLVCTSTSLRSCCPRYDAAAAAPRTLRPRRFLAGASGADDERDDVLARGLRRDDLADLAAAAHDHGLVGDVDHLLHVV